MQDSNLKNGAYDMEQEQNQQPREESSRPEAIGVTRAMHQSKVRGRKRERNKHGFLAALLVLAMVALVAGAAFLLKHYVVDELLPRETPAQQEPAPEPPAQPSTPGPAEPETPELPMRLETYDAYVLLEQLLGEAQAELESAGFATRMVMPDTFCRVRVDVPYFKRVLDNLFANVRKYADPAQPVSIAALPELNTICE